MHFIGPDQLHGFRRRLTTDIYSSDFNWVRPEWIRLKETGGRDCEEVMSNRSMYNARGYTGGGRAGRGVWHKRLELRRGDPFPAPSNTCGPGRKMETTLHSCSARPTHHPHEPFSGRPWTTGTGTKAPR